MNIHEYQAKQLFAQYGVNVPSGEPCTTVDEAKAIAERIFGEGHSKVVVKSQIHAGGRGKGTFKDGFQGGVHLCDSVEDAVAKAEAMLGNVLVTKQTGPEGKQVNTILSPRPKRSSVNSTSPSCSIATAAGRWSWPARKAAWISRRSPRRPRRRS